VRPFIDDHGSDPTTVTVWNQRTIERRCVAHLLKIRYQQTYRLAGILLSRVWYWASSGI